MTPPAYCLHCHALLTPDAVRGTCSDECRQAWVDDTAKFLQDQVDRMPGDIVDGPDGDSPGFSVDDLTVLLQLETAWLNDLVALVRRGIEIRQRLDDALVRLAVVRGSAFRYRHPDEDAGDYASALIEAMSARGPGPYGRDRPI